MTFVFIQPQRILKASTDTLIRRIKRIAFEREPEVSAAFLAAIAKVKDAIVLKRIAEALEQRNLPEVEAAIDMAAADNVLRPRLAKTLRDTLEQSAVVNQDTFPTVSLNFDATNIRATEWARRHAAETVEGVSRQSQAALRDIIVRATEGEYTVDSAARQIRNHIGLNQMQSRAVSNFRANALEGGMKRIKAESAAERYSQKLLRSRAQNIARTEILQATNMGQQELWRQAQEAGLFDGKIVERRWVVTHDDRLCEICAPLDGKLVGLEEEFVGYRHNAQGQIVERYSELTPPLHNQCRCTIALVTRNIRAA